MTERMQAEGHFSDSFSDHHFEAVAKVLPDAPEQFDEDAKLSMLRAVHEAFIDDSDAAKPLSPLRELYETTPPTIELYNHLRALMRYAAHCYAEQLAADPMEPSVVVDKLDQVIEFDHIPAGNGDAQYTCSVAPLRRCPEVVIEYGPGERGTVHVSGQLALIKRSFANGPIWPYRYITMTKGPYIGDILEAYMRQGIPEFVADEVLPTLYRNFDTGMAAGSRSLLEECGEDAEIADVIIASAVASAGYDELAEAIANAYSLLQPDGVLFLRGPKTLEQFPTGSATVTEMLEMAHEAGFPKMGAVTESFTKKHRDDPSQPVHTETYILFKPRKT